VLQPGIPFQNVEYLPSREFHGHKKVVKGKKSIDLLQGDFSSRYIVPYRAAVYHGYIRARLLSHCVANKISYVRFSLAICHKRNKGLAYDPTVFLLNPSVVCLNYISRLFIVLAFLSSIYFF